MLLALIASFVSAGNDVVMKYLLGSLKLPVKYYLPYVFVFLTIVSAFAMRLDSSVTDGAYSLVHVVLFVMMVICAAIWNVQVAESLQSEPLAEYELIMLMTPLVTIVLAAIFLPEEWNAHIFIAGIIASVALIATRIRKHHLQVSKTAQKTLSAVFFIAMETILLRELLNFFAPPILYFLRVLVVTIIFMAAYKPNANVFKHRRATLTLVFLSFFGTALMILKYYAMRSIGVAETTIILLAGPVLTYIASYFYFHERQYFKRDLIGAVIIASCIVYSLAVK